MPRSSLIFISGCIWFCLGAFFLVLGFGRIFTLPPSGNPWLPLVELVSSLTGNRSLSPLLLAAGALATGTVKGRVIFSKSAEKGIARIRQLPEPPGLLNLYSKKYALALLCLIAAGRLLKSPLIPPDLKGSIDISLGTALLLSSSIYFQNSKRG